MITPAQLIFLLALFLVAVSLAAVVPLLLLARFLCRLLDALLERKIAALKEVEDSLSVSPPPRPTDDEEPDIVE